jgi:hypothetical protein
MKREYLKKLLNLQKINNHVVNISLLVWFGNKFLNV